MKTFTVKTRYATYENCFLRYGKYLNGENIYVGIFTNEEPIATLTVNLQYETEDKNCNFLDVNNFPEGINVVYQLGIAKFANKSRASGYCIYPLYKFDIEKIKEYGVEIK